MANSLGPNGLTLNSQQDLINQLTAALQGIYGQDIDVSSSSPDGQNINIFVQATADIQDIIQQVFSSFDPDQAIGTILWQRVGINGIQVQGGSYTTTPVSLVISQALNLYGLDQTDNPVFYVTDNQGNQWNLITSQTISAPGTYVYQFQAVTPGAITVIPNTITVPGLIVLGVTSINNPTVTGTVPGVNQESVAALRIRRQQSVAMPSQSFQQGCQAALGNVPGVSYAKVWENFGQANPPAGVPINTMWAIVGGSGAAAAIAQAIYVNRSLGCNMKGAQTYAVTQPDGTLFTVQWDNVVEESVYVKFTATSIDGINPPNIEAILSQLPKIFVPGIAAEININQLATYVQQIDPNTLVTNAGFSTSPSGPFTNTLSVTALNNQFQITTANIIILPIELLPATSSVPTSGQVQFTASGGSQTFTFSIQTNNSGGNIGSSSGLYTAGSTGEVQDVIQVVDGFGNTTTATVNVT